MNQLKITILKGIYAAPLFLFHGLEKDLAIILGISIFLDTIFGFIKYARNGEVVSNKFRICASKICKYSTNIIVSSLLQKTFEILGWPCRIPFIPLELTFVTGTVGVLIGTELISIIENTGELGFKWPFFIRKSLIVLKQLEEKNPPTKK